MTTKPVSTANPNAAEPAIWRAAMYRALALSFSYPDEEVLEQLDADLESVCEHRLTATSALLPAAEALRAALREADQTELRTTHNALFAGEVPCSPYETEYEFDAFAKARQLADIAGFYRAFGLKVAVDDAAPADHIATELEFMSHLALKEAIALGQSWDERLTVTRDAGRAFLEEHLGSWSPLFCRTLAALDDVDSFYGAAACLCDAMVNREIEEQGVKPRPALMRRRSGIGDEELTCPMAAPAFVGEEDFA